MHLSLSMSAMKKQESLPKINAFLQPLLGLVFVSRRLKKQHEREPEENVHGDRETEIEKNKKNN